MLLYVMVACRARRSHSSRQGARKSIDQQCQSILRVGSGQHGTFDVLTSNYCAAAKVDRQTPVFSAIVQGLDFFIIAVVI
jgi:hypothetical protein